MKLNTLSPDFGSKKKRRRLGRGIGSTLGKTSGRGHKGQKARSGGYHKVGFEGGQMPLQRRLPKMGFKSKIKNLWAELTLTQLNKLPQDAQIDLNTLRESKFISDTVKFVKVIMTGKLDRPVVTKGVQFTAAARQHAIELGSKID
jgi:large subunit ribosomal protein L15